MQTLNQILILFLLLLMGYVSKRLKIISNDMNRDLSNLVIKVALPALIISSLSSYDFEKEMLIKSGALIVISCAVYGLSIFIAAVVPKFYGVEGTTKDIFQFMTVFSNVGFMGYPIINAIYGEQGVFYTALYNLPFNAVLWTYGVMVLSRPMAAPKQVVLDNRGSVQIKQLINPGLVSVMIGLCLFMTSTKLPGPVFSAFQAMGNTSTPLSMIFIGSILADTKVRAIFTNSKIFVASTLRLVVIPVIVMVALRLLGFEGMMVGIPVLISAMPVAANCAIMSTNYGNDYYLASQGIFISTLLSMATIPLIAMLL